MKIEKGKHIYISTQNNKSLKISKRQSELVNRRRADNTMSKKGQNEGGKQLSTKQKIEKYNKREKI